MLDIQPLGALTMRAHYLNAALAAALLMLSAAPAAAQVGRVSGIVRDDSGSPIKGATVTAENPNIGPTTYTATTDDRGRFTIIGLRAGQWRFTAYAPGHAGDVGEMAVRFGSPNPAVAFTLRKNGPTAAAPLGNVAARELQTQLAAADALYAQQKWDEAIAAYRAILGRTPALSAIHLQIAAVYRQKKDYPNAVKAYEALLATEPTSEKARIGIAAIALEQGDQSAAETTLTSAASAEGAGRDVFFSLAELQFSKGDAENAARWYQKAAEADPSWGKPRYRLGLMAMKAGDRTGAARFMTDVVNVDPVSPEAALARTALEQLK
jgi:tetratricopeptide (TPR) repeat protein